MAKLIVKPTVQVNFYTSYGPDPAPITPANMAKTRVILADHRCADLKNLIKELYDEGMIDGPYSGAS